MPAPLNVLLLGESGPLQWDYWSGSPASGITPSLASWVSYKGEQGGQDQWRVPVGWGAATFLQTMYGLRNAPHRLLNCGRNGAVLGDYLGFADDDNALDVLYNMQARTAFAPDVAIFEIGKNDAFLGSVGDFEARQLAAIGAVRALFALPSLPFLIVLTGTTPCAPAGNISAVRAAQYALSLRSDLGCFGGADELGCAITPGDAWGHLTWDGAGTGAIGYYAAGAVAAHVG